MNKYVLIFFDDKEVDFFENKTSLETFIKEQIEVYSNDVLKDFEVFNIETGKSLEVKAEIHTTISVV